MSKHVHQTPTACYAPDLSNLRQPDRPENRLPSRAVAEMLEIATHIRSWLVAHSVPHDAGSLALLVKIAVEMQQHGGRARPTPRRDA